MRIPLIRVDSIPEHAPLLLELLGHEIVVFHHAGRAEAFINLSARRERGRPRQGRWLADRWEDDGPGAANVADTGESFSIEPQLFPLPTRVEDGVLTYVQGE